jgi:hypothetical protein
MAHPKDWPIVKVANVGCDEVFMREANREKWRLDPHGR